MSDYSELERRAQAAIDAIGTLSRARQEREFNDVCTPQVVLALIAENEELSRYLCTCRDCGGEGSVHTGEWHSYSPMEPPEPVMEKCGECDGTGLLGEIQDLYQVITERDQLSAEVAGLRTGYEAYERVNAELKAECEALRAKLENPDPILSQCWDAAIAEQDQVEKDAARYRWTSTEGNWVARMFGKWRAHIGAYGDASPTEWYETREEAIDAAMGKGDRP